MKLWLTVFVAVFVITSGVTLAVPYEQEQWNDPNAGEHGENYWAYWDEDYDGPGEPESENYHNRPMNWMSSGGVDNSGYVWTPLADLWTEHDEFAYWPAYLTDQITEHYGIPDREILLTPNIDFIQMAVKDRALAAMPVDLKGAQIHFFVGQWWHHPSDPDQDQWAFFYNANGSYDFNAKEWTTTQVPVGEGTTDWSIISMSGVGNTNPLPPVSEAWELFDSPQQWGFAIYDPNATVLYGPEGELAFDNFAVVVPEPSAMILLGTSVICLLACAWRRRRR